MRFFFLVSSFPGSRLVGQADLISSGRSWGLVGADWEEDRLAYRVHAHAQETPEV